jgi:hypothetical protein
MHVILEVSPLTEHHLLSRGPDIRFESCRPRFFLFRFLKKLCHRLLSFHLNLDGRVSYYFDSPHTDSHAVRLFFLLFHSLRHTTSLPHSLRHTTSLPLLYMYVFVLDNGVPASALKKLRLRGLTCT